MAVTANTNQTYSESIIKEDLSDALTSISPTECPFMASVGTRDINNTYFEWAEIDLAAAVNNNSKIEGDSGLGNDAPHNAVRKANYSNISTKVVEVSDTANQVSGVADAQTTAKQVAYALASLKRDMEKMSLNNAAANAGASGTARVTAGVPAFLTTNVNRGTGGANGTTSGTGSAGFPNAAATDAASGNMRAITEAMLKSVVADCWTEGAEPSIVLCGASQKQTISAFTGNATKFQEVDGKRLTAAVDIYISDFGSLEIVPARHVRSRDVLVLDPNYAKIAYLQQATQKELARTGLSERRLISAEWGVQVTSEKAHGIIADVS